jgi:GH35 family endo-1,4-beta-xylanase
MLFQFIFLRTQEIANFIEKREISLNWGKILWNLQNLESTFRREDSGRNTNT